MKNHKYIRKKSQKQENRTAKEFSGRTQIASGAITLMKGDVRTGDTSSRFNMEDFLIENKYTDSPKYKLESKIWDKISNEAIKDNLRTPVLQVDIQNVELVIVQKNDLEGMVDTSTLEFFQEEIITDNKSLMLDSQKYMQNLDISPYFAQKVTFIRPKSHLNLVILGKDTFLSMMF